MRKTPRRYHFESFCDLLSLLLFTCRKQVSTAGSAGRVRQQLEEHLPMDAGEMEPRPTDQLLRLGAS